MDLPRHAQRLLGGHFIERPSLFRQGDRFQLLEGLAISFMVARLDAASIRSSAPIDHARRVRLQGRIGRILDRAFFRRSIFDSRHRVLGIAADLFPRPGDALYNDCAAPPPAHQAPIAHAMRGLRL